MGRDRNGEEWNERLSALADGELAPAEREGLMDRLLAEDELRRRWECYHLARACLQGASAPAVEPGFSERVGAAIAAEPAVLAPASPARAAGRVRPAARLAVAAAVALVALGGVAVLEQRDLQPAPAAATGVAEAGAPLASADVLAAHDGAATRRAMRERLSMYLISHNRFAGARDMPAVMPTSRMAGFNAGQ